MPIPVPPAPIGKNSAEITSKRQQLAGLHAQLKKFTNDNPPSALDPYAMLADPKKRIGNKERDRRAEEFLTKLKGDIASLEEQIAALLQDAKRDSNVRIEKVSRGNDEARAFLENVEKDEGLNRDYVVELSKDKGVEMRRKTGNELIDQQDERLDNQLSYELGNKDPERRLYVSSGLNFSVKRIGELQRQLNSYASEGNLPIESTPPSTDTYIEAKTVMGIKEVKRDIDYLIDEGLLSQEWAFELDEINSNEALIMIGSRIEAMLKNPKLTKAAKNRPSRTTPPEDETTPSYGEPYELPETVIKLQPVPRTHYTPRDQLKTNK